VAADAISTGQASFLICVLGDYPFGISLSELTGGKTFRNHRIEVRWLHNPLESRFVSFFSSANLSAKGTTSFSTMFAVRWFYGGETPSSPRQAGLLLFQCPGKRSNLTSISRLQTKRI